MEWKLFTKSIGLGVKMDTNQYIRLEKQKNSGYFVIPPMICVDGFTMSVQVSRTHYCSPREDNAQDYYEVEVGYPSETEELLLRFAEDEDKPTKTVYGYVPVSIVDAVIEKHGGLK